MATPLPLEGDGLVENLFHYLWTTDDLGGGPRVSVPPTVIYRGSQPVAWYFTSRRSGRIKRKHRANLTAAHIEHSFTKRRASTDIVAYYLYLPNSESTNPAIEYYDAEALREFLFKRPEIPHSSTGAFQSGGILQRFALPKGSRNSTLRAIWSPKLCLLERRVNVHAVHDARFSVYERGVTFEEGGGAEALTRPEPVRGSMLPGMVQQLCERVVDHVTRVSYHKFRIARMVLRLQVDADDRMWLLWSSSLRLQPPLAPTTMIGPDMPIGEPSIRPLDIVSDAKVPTFAFAQGSGGGPVSLSSTSGLEVGEEPRPGQTRCASCAQVVAQRALLPTTYKAVLAHFQHVLRFLREKVNEENQVAIEWPPDDRVVQQAGGVGFGILRHLKSMSSSVDDSSVPKLGSGLKMWQGRELLIPPVIRYLHPMLRTEDFARHRQDPIFLHKTVGVCERCCLVYADYATASLEANALGIRSSASAPALLRPVREKPKHAEYFDDEAPDSLLLTTNLRSPLARGAHVVASKTKPPASAWKPIPTEDRQQSVKYKTGPRSTLHSLPMAPKLPPRIETFEPGDNDALRIPDAIIHDDGSPQHQQQQREEAFFRELYQQKDTVKRGGHALRHILEAADRLSKAKPQHRLAALGNNSQIGQSQSTGALAGAISELKLSKKPGKSPYSLVQRIRDGDGGKVSLSKAQKSGDASPAKSPVTYGSKPVRKKSSKKKNSQDEAGVERTRFISSREKRAAAAHRGYLVAALSDAQVQLEHIESLATLVISAPDIKVEPIKPGLKDEQQLQITKGKRPPSPQERDSASEEQDTLAGDESLRDQQLEFEEGCQEEDLQQQEEPQIRELEEEHEDDDLQQQEPQRQESEQEQEYQEQGQEQHDEEFEDQGYVGSHLDDAQEDQEDAESMHEEGMQTQHNVLEDEQGPTGQEKLENLDQSSLKAHNTGLDLVQESRHELTGYEQENEEGTQLKDQDLYESHNNGTANQLIGESQDQSEVEHEPKGGQELEDYSEDLGSKLDLQEQEDRTLAGQIVQTPTCEQDAEFYQDQELGSVQQQEQVQGQEDEDQDEYDDEYEDQDVEHEQDHRDQKVQDGILQINQVEHDDSIAAPAQNLLMQAQELLATEASSDSTDDDHRAAHGHDGSSDTGDSNDLSILTPLVPDSVAHDDDSSDDAIIAADSVVATALPLPSSDESSCEAADE